MKSAFELEIEVDSLQRRCLEMERIAHIALGVLANISDLCRNVDASGSRLYWFKADIEHEIARVRSDVKALYEKGNDPTF